MEILNRIFGKQYICVFCDERMRAGRAHIHAGDVGICRECFERLSKTAPSQPYPGIRNISYIISPFEYKDAMRQAILGFKFENCRAYAPLFAEMMREYLFSYDIWDKFNYIVPVPLHRERLKERGYNQSELIAEKLSDIIAVPTRKDIVQRNRPTRRQSGLKRLDRVINVKGAFSCPKALSGENIILFDDICTTGSTLQACAEALDNAGAGKICAVTLAIHTSENLPVIMY